MHHVLSISEARSQFMHLPDELLKEPETISVTRHGKPVIAILSWDVYESILETIEILSDAKLTKELHQSIKELDEHKLVSWKKYRKSYLSP